jgi:hypothetical protein
VAVVVADVTTGAEGRHSGLLVDRLVGSIPPLYPRLKLPHVGRFNGSPGNQVESLLAAVRRLDVDVVVADGIHKLNAAAIAHDCGEDVGRGSGGSGGGS